MGAGFGGTYVLTIGQTTLDGAPVLPGRLPRIGQIWQWQGEAVRLDGSQSILTLDHAMGHRAFRARVARSIERRFDLPFKPEPDMHVPEELHDGFIISDGVHHYQLIPISTQDTAHQLLWCPDGVPFAGHTYHVSQVPTEDGSLRRDPGLRGDVICFTAGTKIRTEDGDKPVEHLDPGDRVLTQDNGPQEVSWIGSRRVSGARLHVMPELRPIRLRAHALTEGEPEEDLLVSPHHRILYSGANARALFNADEVLVRAMDLVNDHTVLVDRHVRDVIYYHLLFENHQILWANGVPSESFHPANTSLASIDAAQRELLFAVRPELELDAHHYGPSARRNLSKADVAILFGGPH
ncbi:MAG: Hint domain-containing protein [Pseudomonadota bacterium]